MEAKFDILIGIANVMESLRFKRIHLTNMFALNYFEMIDFAQKEHLKNCKIPRTILVANIF